MQISSNSSMSTALNTRSAWALFVIMTLALVRNGSSVAEQDVREFSKNQTRLQEDAQCTCIDIPPLGGLTCTEQKSQGKCGEWWMLWGDFCAITCGRCTCGIPLSQSSPDDSDACDCTDVSPPGNGDCKQQRKWGKCDADWMVKKTQKAPRGFCEQTCGRCTCPNELNSRPKVPVALTSGGNNCTCTDIMPPGQDFTCEEQRVMGKCEADWMFNTTLSEGYCQTTCGRCQCPQIEIEESAEIPCAPFREFLNKTEGISLYASLFQQEVMDSFIDSILGHTVTILVPRDEGFQQFLNDLNIDIQALADDPFIVLSSIIQPNVLSMGAYQTRDFLPTQMLLTQSGFTIKVDALPDDQQGWYFSGDRGEIAAIVQPDIRLCQAVVQIISQPVIPQESLQQLVEAIPSTSNPEVVASPSPSFIPIATNLTRPKTCVPFTEFLDIIDGVSLYSQLFEDEKIRMFMETSLQEPVTILIPMDEGFIEFLDERQLTLEKLKGDPFTVLEQLITPSVITDGAYNTSTFTPQKQFVINKEFNLSVEQMQDDSETWYFKGCEEDLALISQPDISLCKAVVHVVTKPLVPEIHLDTKDGNYNPIPVPTQSPTFAPIPTETLSSNFTPYAIQSPQPQNYPPSPNITQMLQSLQEFSQQDNISSYDVNYEDAKSLPTQKDSTPTPTLTPTFSPIPATNPSLLSPASLKPIFVEPSITPTSNSNDNNSSSQSSSPSLQPISTQSPPPSKNISVSIPTISPVPKLVSSPSYPSPPVPPPLPSPPPTNQMFPIEVSTNQSTGTCEPFGYSLKELDDVSLFAKLFENEFLESYMQQTLQQEMTIFVPDDEGFQSFMDRNDLTMEYLFNNPFMVLVSIVQPNIVIMGAYEVEDFAVEQSLLTQSGSTLDVDQEAGGSVWHLYRDTQSGYIVQPNIHLCKTVAHVISDPLIAPHMIEEAAKVTDANQQQTLQPFNNDLSKTYAQNQNSDSKANSFLSPTEQQAQLVNVTMQIELVKNGTKQE